MKYFIKAEDKLIAEMYDIMFDDSMGVITGKYIPLGAYKVYKDIIKQYSRLVFNLNIDKTKSSDLLKQLREKISDFKITIYDESNVIIKYNTIDLRDYSDELGEEGYEITLYQE